jgi:hypothetical protein
MRQTPLLPLIGGLADRRRVVLPAQTAETLERVDVNFARTGMKELT